MPNDSVDIVTRAPWSAVRAAMRLLTTVADARTTVQAERQFDKLESRAEKSSALADATYVAAQVLRDMDVLSQSEATYVFRGLFDLRSEEYSRNDAYHQAHLNAYVKEKTEQPSAADSDECVDRLTDELIARTNVLETRFHHARGEHGLAKLLLRDADTARKLFVDGEWSLIARKFGPDDEEDDEPDLQSSVASGSTVVFVDDGLSDIDRTMRLLAFLRSEAFRWRIIAEDWQPRSSVNGAT